MQNESLGKLMTLNKNTADFFSVLVITIGTSYLYYHTFSFSPSMLPGYPGDSFFPRLVLGFTLFCCALILFRTGKTLFADNAPVVVNADKKTTVTIELLPFSFIILLVLAYIFLLPVIGFETCTFLFLFILLITRWFEDWKPRIIKVGVLSLGTALFFYFAFVILLNVSFPVKLLPDYIKIL
jgi:hypothetical protein